MLDDWLPPVVREWRPLNTLLARTVHGASFDLDFKERAFRMSDRAIAEATTGSVLEVGCGNGMVAQHLRDAGHAVVAVDVTLGSALATRERTGCHVMLAGLPDLPFRDRAFDTVVCSHTLEHIPDLWRAAAELRRVARRVVVVVPCQRYYRYTVDYHLHFFPTSAPLEHLLGGRARLIDGDWVVIANT